MWKMMRFIKLIVAIAAFTGSSAYVHSEQSAIQSDQPNRVVIEYVAPKDAAFQNLYEILKIKGALERIQRVLSPLRLPEELTVKTDECGKVDAWYSRDNSKPTVTICYELLKSILDSLPKETTAAGITPDEAKIGQVLWLTLHEVGHATFDIFKVPLFGHEEDAADNFATYVMLQFAEARSLIGGAAWAWSAYMHDYKRNPVVQVRLASFAGNHGLPQERFYNLLCLAFGSDPVLFADLAQEDYLPAMRAPNCQHEYRVMADAFHKEITPHIDWELAKRVKEANWLPGPVLRPEPKTP
jgi:hypothetical protein